MASSRGKLLGLDCFAVLVGKCLADDGLFEHLCLSEDFLISF